jgi:hypothetical protein
MKKLLRVGRKILTCAAFLSIAVIIAVVIKLNKKADPNEIFLLKAQITGSHDLIKEYDKKISECVSFMRFKNDSISDGDGDRDILKEGVDKLQKDINEFQNSIVFYKKAIINDSIAYKKLVKK